MRIKMTLGEKREEAIMIWLLQISPLRMKNTYHL